MGCAKGQSTGVFRASFSRGDCLDLFRARCGRAVVSPLFWQASARLSKVFDEDECSEVLRVKMRIASFIFVRRFLFAA